MERNTKDQLDKLFRLRSPKSAQEQRETVPIVKFEETREAE